MATEATATGEAALMVAGKGIRSPDAFCQTNYAGKAAFEQTINKASLTLDTEGGVEMALDRYDVAMRKRVQDTIDYIGKELEANRDAPLAEKLAIWDRADARFGSTWELTAD